MTYYNDYKEMLESTYINAKFYEGLKIDGIPNRISELKHELNDKSYDEKILIRKILNVMTELAIYRMCLEIKMKTNFLKDPKNPERKYVQVRGSVRISKNKRIWVGVYIGTDSEVCDPDGNVLPEKFSKGREGVIKKIVERFVAQHLG
jgi:hypothetical protein